MLKKILSFVGLEVVVSAGKLLNRADRTKIYLVAMLQVSLSVLDLIGVGVIGVLGAISISGLQSQRPGSRISSVLEILNLETSSLQMQATVLGILATTILVSRTFLSIFITRRYIYFLSRKGSEITLELVGKILGAPLLKVQERTVQETIYALTESIKALTLGVLATSVMLFSDLALMLVLAAGLFVVDPMIALSTITLFGIVGFALHKSMTNRSTFYITYKTLYINQ